ncbi:hypothetical protein LCGC14_2629540, partial [marine sediment metagenome]
MKFLRFISKEYPGGVFAVVE